MAAAKGGARWAFRRHSRGRAQTASLGCRRSAAGGAAANAEAGCREACRSKKEACERRCSNSSKL
eukprot:15474217-Alexandrium_andersonii.AAC.1